jgi:nitrate reductase NapE
MLINEANMSDSETSKKSEVKAFLFITVFLFPLVSVAIVGGYGFLIWMSQILFGSSTY